MSKDFTFAGPIASTVPTPSKPKNRCRNMPAFSRVLRMGEGVSQSSECSLRRMPMFRHRGSCCRKAEAPSAVGISARSATMEANGSLGFRKPLDNCTASGA